MPKEIGGPVLSQTRIRPDSRVTGNCILHIVPSPGNIRRARTRRHASLVPLACAAITILVTILIGRKAADAQPLVTIPFVAGLCWSAARMAGVGRS